MNNLIVNGERLHVAQIGGMCVHPDFRHRGIAGELLESTLKKAQRVGIDKYVLCAAFGSAGYLHARKHGFVELLRWQRRLQSASFSHVGELQVGKIPVADLPRKGVFQLWSYTDWNLMMDLRMLGDSFMIGTDSRDCAHLLGTNNGTLRDLGVIRQSGECVFFEAIVPPPAEQIDRSSEFLCELDIAMADGVSESHELDQTLMGKGFQLITVAERRALADLTLSEPCGHHIPLQHLGRSCSSRSDHA